jgi:D-sedoheptulose 7-phosphate isomerase
MTIFQKSLTDHVELFGRLAPLEPSLARIAGDATRVLQGGGRLFFCGNGGSAADAQHIAAELVGRFVHDRRALKAIALTTDTSALTCIGNDFGFDHVFARQLEGVASAGDMVFLITTSGNSRNLTLAAEAARSLGVRSVGLLGKGGGKLLELVDDAIVVPGDETARIQEAHIFLGHVLCAAIESNLGLGQWQNWLAAPPPTIG